MDLKNVKIGDAAPDKVNVVVEIPRGSDIKYEINAKTGKLKVDRVIGSALVYPYSYGYIPETLADDGDALDMMVLSIKKFKTKQILEVRPIGVLSMEDENGRDEKILVIPVNESDYEFSQMTDLTDLNLSVMEKIDIFFKHYKEMDKKRWSKVHQLKNKQEAFKIIKRCRNKYKI